MSEKIKNIIGDELYQQILAKGLKSSDFDLLEGFIPKIRFDEVNGKLKTATKQIGELETLASSSKDLSEQLEALKIEHTNTIKSSEKEFTNYKKTSMFKDMLSKENAKYHDLLMSKIDLEKLSIDTNGSLIGSVEMLDSLKQEFGDLFPQMKQVNTNNTPISTPPSANDGNDNWDDIIKSFI